MSAHHHKHITNQIQHHEMKSDNTLHVIGVVSNFARWHSRYRLFREWVKEMEETPNVKLYLVETALGDHKFECTEHDNSQHLQLRTHSEAWVKESMINAAERFLLPKDWKYMAWVDTDVSFDNKGWAGLTINALQRFPVVQPWQQCIDLGPHGNIMQTFQSFGWMHQCGVQKQRHSKDPYQYCHSGFAWACRRHFFEALPGRGLLDCMVLGSADYNMAWGMVGDIDATIHGDRSTSLIRRLKEWEKAAFSQTKGQVGYVIGYIKHYFHGPKRDRQYESRDQILSRCGFDPDKDLGYDEQGLIRIFNNSNLEHSIQKYNRSRNEDSIEQF